MLDKVHEDRILLIRWLQKQQKSVAPHEDYLRIGPRAITFLLAHGEFYLPSYVLPAECRGESQYCFRNAQDLARVSSGEMIYCEGFSYPLPASEDADPRHHTWCINPAGGVVEPTWEHLGATYFGVCFSADMIAHWQEGDYEWALLEPRNLDRLPNNWKHATPQEWLVKPHQGQSRGE